MEDSCLKFIQAKQEHANSLIYQVPFQHHKVSKMIHPMLAPENTLEDIQEALSFSDGKPKLTGIKSLICRGYVTCDTFRHLLNSERAQTGSFFKQTNADGYLCLYISYTTLIVYICQSKSCISLAISGTISIALFRNLLESKGHFQNQQRQKRQGVKSFFLLTPQSKNQPCANL